MIQIRPRWTLMAMALAGMGYGANQYRVAELEKSQSTDSASTSTLQVPRAPVSGNSPWKNNAGFGGPHDTTVRWKEQLSVGERLALQQDELSTEGLFPSPPRPESGPSFPISSPIPLPPNFSLDGSKVENPAAVHADALAAETHAGAEIASNGQQIAPIPLRGVDMSQLPGTAPTTDSLADSISAAIPPTAAALPENATRDQLEELPSFAFPSTLPSQTELAPATANAMDGGVNEPQGDASATSVLPPELAIAALERKTSIATSLVEPPKPKLLYEDRADIVRIATFNTRGLGAEKLEHPHLLHAMTEMLKNFDVIALQEIRSTRDDIMPTLVDALNVAGRQYDYLIGPRVGRGSDRAQYAIIFDATKLETDRYQLYTVDDADDLLMYEPLVAWFRCKGVSPNTAFTFSLVNVCLNRDLAVSEREILPRLFDAVSRDGRFEDDLVFAGSFEGGPQELSSLANAGVRFAARESATNIMGTHALDSIFFPQAATTEFTGRSGVHDFLRISNLSIEQAQQISDRLPVWAEFSIVEGLQPGQLAPGLKQLGRSDSNLPQHDRQEGVKRQATLRRAADQDAR